MLEKFIFCLLSNFKDMVVTFLGFILIVLYYIFFISIGFSFIFTTLSICFCFGIFIWLVYKHVKKYPLQLKSKYIHHKNQTAHGGIIIITILLLKFLLVDFKLGVWFFDYQVIKNNISISIGIFFVMCFVSILITTSIYDFFFGIMGHAPLHQLPELKTNIKKSI